MDFLIQDMRRGDVPYVVDTHLEAFPGFFLSRLGPRFLGEFYGSLLRNSLAVARVAKSKGDDVLGFCVGVTDQQSLYREMLRERWLHFSLAAVPAVLREPSMALGVAAGVLRPREAKSATTAALLMSIGVHPRRQGGGLGKAMMLDFAESMHKRGVQYFSLTTDRDDNCKANEFYMRLGMLPAAERKNRRGRWMVEYVGDAEELARQSNETLLGR